MPDLLTSGLLAMGFSPTLAATLLETAGPLRPKQAGERLTVEGEAPVGLIMVASGVLKGSRNLDTGATQTVALYTPGDVLGSQALALGREPATILTVAPARLAIVPAARLRTLMERDPSITEGLWRASVREAAILREWLVGMGRRTALSQMAHLLCEIAVRMRAGGRANGDTCSFPLTQVELADVAGLSPVHVNRVLQTLRAEGLVELGRGRLHVVDWSRLVEAGDFDASYLDLPSSAGNPHGALLLSSHNADWARDGRDRDRVRERGNGLP